MIIFKQWVNHNTTDNNETNVLINLWVHLQQPLAQDVQDPLRDDMFRVFIDKQFHQEQLNVILNLDQVAVLVDDFNTLNY